jgi:hypothetical protein
MKLTPLRDIDKSWPALKSQWQAECSALKEDFSTFAVGTFGALNSLAAQDTEKSGLYGLQTKSGYDAFCQVNRLLSAKFDGPLLRARFVTVSPRYDFGQQSMAEYGQVLVTLFSGAVWLAGTEQPARHVRFHLRSPADGQFFHGISAALASSPFSQFGIQGSWIECSLRD